MRKMVMLLLSVGMLLGLAGCAYKTEVKISKDGTVKCRDLAYLTDEELEGNEDMSSYEMDGVVISEDTFLKTQKINGTTYNVFTNGWEEEEIDDDYEAPYSAYDWISEKEFYEYPNELQDLDENAKAFGQGMMSMVSAGYDFYDMSITFPYPVVCTNGTLSKDKKTVTFHVLEQSTEPEGMYAYTSKGEHFVRLDKYVTTGKCSVLCPIKLTSVTLNGKPVKDSSNITLSKDGTYTIKAKHKYGTETMKVIRDTVKPTISGVKNKKTYTKPVTLTFKDNIEFAYVTVNEESMKDYMEDNTLVLSDKGSYDVKAYDTAGNMKRVQFVIK